MQKYLPVFSLLKRGKIPFFFPKRPTSNVPSTNFGDQLFFGYVEGKKKIRGGPR
jgi:hypothetical protein